MGAQTLVLPLKYIRSANFLLYVSVRSSHTTTSLEEALNDERRIPNQGAVRTEEHRYTPDQHERAALVRRGWLTSGLIIGPMPIPTLRNEARPLLRANYQSRPLRSQQEMTWGVHVICSACQRTSALRQIKCKHQWKSEWLRQFKVKSDAKQPEMWSCSCLRPLGFTPFVLDLKYYWPVFRLASLTWQTALGLFGMCWFHWRDSRAWLLLSHLQSLDGAGAMLRTGRGGEF